MFETVRGIGAFGIDEARPARVVVRRRGQGQEHEAAERRGPGPAAADAHGAPSTRIRLPFDALWRIAIATLYPSESYQALACS